MISNLDGLIAAMATSTVTSFFRTANGETAGFWHTLWRGTGRPGGGSSAAVTPGTALSRLSAGALTLPAPSGTSYFTGFRMVSSSVGIFALVDRLVEVGGLSGTSTTAQTVSSVALPARATGATDVEFWVENITATGVTPSPTVTASYTNSSGTSGRTATLPAGIPASWAATRTYPMRLQDGDTGVQSVETITSTLSTGTVGNWAVVLRRTLLQVSLANSASFSLGYPDTDLIVCPDDAALELMHLSASTSSGTTHGNVTIAQG